MWRSAPGPAGSISLAAARASVALAQEAMVSQVLKPDWARLGPLERKALAAMSRDNGPTATSDVRSRLRMTSSTWATYRRRLIDAGMIVAPRRGQVDFGHEPMRHWVRTRTEDNRDDRADHEERPKTLRDRILGALAADETASYASIGRAVGAHRRLRPTDRPGRTANPLIPRCETWSEGRWSWAQGGDRCYLDIVGSAVGGPVDVTTIRATSSSTQLLATLLRRRDSDLAASSTTSGPGPIGGTEGRSERQTVSMTVTSLPGW